MSKIKNADLQVSTQKLEMIELSDDNLQTVVGGSATGQIINDIGNNLNPITIALAPLGIAAGAVTDVTRFIGGLF